MRTFRLLAAACASACLFILPVAVKAASLDFGIVAPTSGTLSYAGGDNPLVGEGIDVDNIVGLDTPLNNNVFSTCSFCSLDFQTGASTGGWNFGAGGTITITGGIDFIDATPDIPAGSTLLQGTFNTATIIDLGGGTFEFQILGASFTDSLHAGLTDFYGMPGGLYDGGLNISFQTTAAMGDAFNTTALLSGDIVNQPVPVPAAVWLFSSGLLGLAGIGRRKKT